MTRFSDSEISRILPDYLKDSPEVEGISYAISRQMKRYVEHSKNIGVYAMLDSIPENMLDMLAVELDAPYYRQDMETDIKRSLIKGTLGWYARAGTPAAVGELVAAVFGEGEVKEWFEYGDKPYFFKVITNAFLTPDTFEKFSRMLEKVKNTRSHIRGIEIKRHTDMNIKVGVGYAAVYRPEPIITKFRAEQYMASKTYSGMTGEFIVIPEPIK